MRSMGGVGGELTWRACYYHCYCYYSNTLKKILNVYFLNKNEKMPQTDLNSDLKGERDFKSRCCFSLFELVIPES